jgi:uncharacterized protein
MKFQPDQLAGVNVISRIERDRLWVNATEWRQSVLVPWVGEARVWAPPSPEALESAHFDEILAYAPDVVIFGSGPSLRFVTPALYRGLIAKGIGLETMDTGAACRTYNVLAAEGRRVLAAVLLGPAG